MSLNKDVLENQILDAVISRLSPAYKLSDKAKRRITKSAGKLADRLFEIFEKKERKAARKAGEIKVDQQSSDTPEKAEEDNDDLN